MSARGSRRTLSGTLMGGLALLAGCRGTHHALDPAGIQAARISSLWWFMVIVSGVVYLIVVGFLFYAALRRRPPEEEGTEPVTGARTHPEVERRLTWWVGGGVVATVVILFVFLVVDLGTGRAMASVASPDALVIRITGHQWWWQVEYEDPVAQRRLLTANEIHVPVGRPVLLKMSSADVIHSFWVPNIHGKKDLIPGYLSTTWFRADEPGVYRGQCAEFCGHQHAKMGLLLVAETPERFAAWYEEQLQPAAPPADSLQARGQEIFLSRSCVMCHTVRGTLAGGRVAPDLTHLASRRTLAAAAIPNTRGHLGGWISNPQRIKPGVRMPPNQFSSDELRALLSYLESLR